MSSSSSEPSSSSLPLPLSSSEPSSSSSESSTTSAQFECNVCHEVFATRNKMYRHLEDHAIIIPSKLKKIVILIGWLANPLDDDSDEFISSEDTLRMKVCDETSDKVDTDLCRAILSVEGDYFQSEIDPLTRKPKTYIRASKSSQRSSFICQAEASVNGICDTVLFASRVWPAGDKDWIDRVNNELLTINCNIKVLHRYVMVLSSSSSSLSSLSSLSSSLSSLSSSSSSSSSLPLPLPLPSSASWHS